MKNSDSDPESSSSSQGADNIMRQLHASDSQGVERKREVVVRPDGSKVIRVEKRRRPYNDDHGDAKQAVLKTSVSSLASASWSCWLWAPWRERTCTA